MTEEAAESSAPLLPGTGCGYEWNTMQAAEKRGSRSLVSKDMCLAMDYTGYVAENTDRALHETDWRHDEANAVS